MNNQKTTVFGTVASIAGAVATSSTGIVQIIATTVAALFGSLFAYHSKDK
jgi:hypothetical protein